MHAIWSEIRCTVTAVAVLAVLLGGIYPLAVWGVGRLLFPWRAAGSLVWREGRPSGSLLIGQAFASPRFFHPRPAASGDGHDPRLSGGANLGPLSRELRQRTAERIRRYRRENGLSPAAVVPIEAVTASASGLDPHISEADAVCQSGRVAAARGWPRQKVLTVLRSCLEERWLGILGERRINVLRLNLALDRMERK